MTRYITHVVFHSQQISQKENISKFIKIIFIVVSNRSVNKLKFDIYI